MPVPKSATGSARAQLIADTALDLLAERGMRGLTHRAVDEAAGLPLGSTSNQARTRLALLEIAVRRLALRESEVLGLPGLPAPAAGREALAEAVALALHRSLTGQRALLIARYELALEAARRPELRRIYDSAGRVFREPLTALMAAHGSPEPERHALSLIAWCEGMMFSCVAGSFHAETPGLAQLRAGAGELLRGMLGGTGGGR
ncbi:TetR/AcrR family transcriptional regulator [Streptomyces sp. UNOC14_S4]|uniref:TetR/AcrR family transcriptional regulator n=1 Tax=Streptomyces sp. UNOC14_S4 TaxID=2872340 RepID=UPI001E465D95|nr:TetR/AcrR family transcriptional regulator [Streptomyces sp. UNOC14_S4]MCC3771755.1 TetR/AcrR family transcriptional regulator [Streptomyces sp. UNOC14_S4]